MAVLVNGPRFYTLPGTLSFVGLTSSKYESKYEAICAPPGTLGYLPLGR